MELPKYLANLQQPIHPSLSSPQTLARHQPKTVLINPMKLTRAEHKLDALPGYTELSRRIRLPIDCHSRSRLYGPHLLTVDLSSVY